MSRATQSELLEQRIAENRLSQEVDLTKWIFERLSLNASDQVLELCCGTGGQTLEMLRIVGEDGRVYAIDISRDALQTLTTRAGAEGRKLVTIEGNLEDVSGALTKCKLAQPAFDLVFCAYGLYYSKDPVKTLEELASWLKRNGRLAVVGPFGPNNGPLFKLLRASGVEIPEAVMFSSDRFMTQVVLPWSAVRFQTVRVHTMVNPVRWQSAERALNYWANTTFYSAEHRPEVERRLRDHFEGHADFVNEKWVMMVEMMDART